jgi:GDPmannose 4,6-dehydratase
MAFSEIGLTLSFKGEGKDEVAIVSEANGKYKVPVGQVVAKVDPHYYRPTEVDLLIGDATKAKNKLGWEPKYQLSEMIREMVASDLRLFEKDQFLKESGFDIKNEFE